MTGSAVAICPACGHRGPPAEPCGSCGRAVDARPERPPPVPRCPACGSTAAGPRSTRCPSCGLSLRREEPDVLPPPPPADRRLVIAVVVVAGLVAAALLVARSGGSAELGAAWRLRFAGTAAGSIAVDGRSALLTTGDGAVIAIDPVAGEARWRFEAGSPALGPAVAAGGSAFVAIAGRDEQAVIFALDTRTGGERWRVTTELTSPRGLAAGDGVLHIADGEIVTVDAVTGNERWRRRVEGSSGAIAAGEGLLTVVTREGVAAYDSASGTPRWTWRSDGRPAWRPAVGGGVVLTDDGASAVVAVDARTGGERWRVSTGGLVHEPVIAGPLALLATSGGVMAVDAGTGEVIWEEGPSGRDDLRAGSDGTHVAHLTDELVARVAATGDVVGRTRLDGLARDPEPPVVMGSVVLVVLNGAVQGHLLR